MAQELEFHTSKYTAEEIDQRLLQGYYDDVVSRGYTGSKEEFLTQLNNIITNLTNNTLDKLIANGSITTSKLDDGCVTSKKLAEDAIPVATIARNGLMTRAQVIALSEVANRNYSTPSILGNALVGQANSVDIITQSWNIYIEDPFSSPQDTPLSSVMEISENSILLSLRGGFIAYDSLGGIVMADVYEKYIADYLHYEASDRKYYFDPTLVVDLSNKGISKIIGCIIIEWVG